MTQEQTLGNEQRSDHRPYELFEPWPLKGVSLSEPAEAALIQHAEIAHESGNLERARRRASIIRDFAGPEVPAWIVDVVGLADLADRAAVKTREHRNSRKYLARYMSMMGMTNPENDEVVKALACLPYVEQRIGAAVRSRREVGDAVLGSANERLALDDKTRRHVAGAETEWGQDLDNVQLADPRTMLELTEMNMFVPLLTKATQTLDLLHNWRELTRGVAVAKARDALEVYAPFCEIIGYDGMTLELSNAANSLKVRDMKHYSESRADAVRDRYERMFAGDAHYRVIAGLLDRESTVFESPVHTGPASNNVKIGSFVGELAGTNVEGRYRVKGFNTLLRKLFLKWRNDVPLQEQLPMDTLGITFITDSPEESAAVIGKLLERISADGETYQPKPTEGRRRKKYAQGYIHVQGVEDYINTICATNGIDRKNISTATLRARDYEVAKITFLVADGAESIPVEIQVITRSARKEARRGIVSHILYKLFGKLSNDAEQLNERERVAEILDTIHERRDTASNPISLEDDRIGPVVRSFVTTCQSAGV